MVELIWTSHRKTAKGFLKYMLSRRSIRVKVMQILYAVNRDEEIDRKSTNKLYWANVDKSYELFLYNLYVLTEVARISKEDFDQRKTKYLPSDFDKKFTAKLFENDSMVSIEKNIPLKKIFKKYHFSERTDKDAIRKIYQGFSKEEAYETFVVGETTSESVRGILLELFRFCRQNEIFSELMEDQFNNWEDEKSLVVGSVKKVLKAIPIEGEMFIEDFYPDDETIKEFGELLLTRTYEEDNAFLELIKPTLKNWDSERVAIIDMILLKMAVCEFLNFESIPTKVTLNEYVELSKVYSTPKSKEFINGVLDKMVVNLNESGQIKKSGRGLAE